MEGGKDLEGCHLICFSKMVLNLCVTVKRIPVQGILSICLVSNSTLAGRLVRLVICSLKNRMCRKIWKAWTTCVIYQLDFLRMGKYVITSNRYHFIRFCYHIYYEIMKQRQQTSGSEFYMAAEKQNFSLFL